MGKVIRNAILGLLVAAFILFSGVMMNRSTKLLEHWAYPIEYSEIVEAKAEEYEIPLSVIYAVIRTESNFDQNAESRAAARGLMQLTKETYEWIDYYRGATGAEWEDFFDPEVNIDYGVWYIRYLYREFENWDTVYVAYNAGPNAVKNWLNKEKYSADGITLHTIPYEESSYYREKVSVFRKGYQTVYGFD